jgi:hypothetical protein
MLGKPLHGNVTGKKTDLDKPLYANIGIGRDFEGYIDLGEVTDAERCFVCSCDSSRSAECQTSLPRKELIEDNVPYDVSTAAMINASTRLSFETPQENRFLQFPAASGRVISAGNLADITSVSALKSPVFVQPTHDY